MKLEPIDITGRKLSNRSFVRLRVKIQFILLTLEIFKEHEKRCLVNNIKYRRHRTPEAMKITRLARTKIGYKDSYCDQDLFDNLERLYGKVMNLTTKKCQ